MQTTHTKCQDLPELLFHYRTEQQPRVSLRALARRLHLSPMCLSEFERRVKTPRRETRKIIEDFLRSQGYTLPRRAR